LHKRNFLILDHLAITRKILLLLLLSPHPNTVSALEKQKKIMNPGESLSTGRATSLKLL
jgi:hypothetical protein